MSETPPIRRHGETNVEYQVLVSALFGSHTDYIMVMANENDLAVRITLGVAQGASFQKFVKLDPHRARHIGEGLLRAADIVDPPPDQPESEPETAE